MKTLHLSSYAIIQSDLSRELKNHFAIPADLIPELDEYRLVYWSASHLYKRLKDNQLESNDIKYQITMLNCSLISIYDLALNEPDSQIRISFRRARKHWNLLPYAIIKLPAPLNGLPVLADRNYNHD